MCVPGLLHAAGRTAWPQGAHSTSAGAAQRHPWAWLPLPAWVMLAQTARVTRGEHPSCQVHGVPREPSQVRLWRLLERGLSQGEVWLKRSRASMAKSQPERREARNATPPELATQGVQRQQSATQGCTAHGSTRWDRPRARMREAGSCWPPPVVVCSDNWPVCWVIGGWYSTGCGHSG